MGEGEWHDVPPSWLSAEMLTVPWLKQVARGAAEMQTTHDTRKSERSPHEAAHRQQAQTVPAAAEVLASEHNWKSPRDQTRARATVLVLAVATAGLPAAHSMPLGEVQHLEGSARRLLQNDDGGGGSGVDSKLLIGVLVPVGVLLMCVAFAIYRYSFVFRKTAGADKKDGDNEGVSADGGVYADVGFHDTHAAGTEERAPQDTLAIPGNGSGKFVGMDGEAKGLAPALAQKLKEKEKAGERKRGSGNAHPGIGLGSVFGDGDKGGGGSVQAERESEESAGGEPTREESPQEGAERGRKGREATKGTGQLEEEEEERGGRGGAIAAVAEVGARKAGEEDKSPGSASKAETEPVEEKAGAGGAGQGFGGITALGTQPVQVWQDAPFAHAPADIPLAPPHPEPPADAGLAVPAGPAPPSAAAAFVPRPLPSLPADPRLRARMPLPAPPRRPSPPASPPPPSAHGLDEHQLQLLLRAQHPPRRHSTAPPQQPHPLDLSGPSVPSEPDSPPPMSVRVPPQHPLLPSPPASSAPPPTLSIAGLYAQASPGARAAPAAPLLIDGTGQPLPLPRGATLPPSFSPGASRSASRDPASRASPGLDARHLGGGLGRPRQGALGSRDPRRRRVMNLHKEMFGNTADPEGITKPVELPGDKGVSYYQGRSSLAGRMAYASIEFGAMAPKAPFVPPGGMRDEDEMWG